MEYMTEVNEMDKAVIAFNKAKEGVGGSNDDDAVMLTVAKLLDNDNISLNAVVDVVSSYVSKRDGEEFNPLTVDNILRGSVQYRNIMPRDEKSCINDYAFLMRISEGQHDIYNAKEKATDIQEGKVMLDLMRVYGYPTQMVLDVVKNHAFNEAHRRDSFISSMKFYLDDAREKYDSILGQGTGAEQSSNFYADVARRHLKKYKLKTLSFRDDQIISQFLYGKCYDNLKKNADTAKSGIPDSVIKENVLGFISDLVRKSSPVAAEPWRDKEKYLKAIKNSIVSSLDQKHQQYNKQYMNDILTIYSRHTSDLVRRTREFDFFDDEMRRNAIIASFFIVAQVSTGNIATFLLDKNDNGASYASSKESAEESIELGRKLADRQNSLINCADRPPFVTGNITKVSDLVSMGTAVPEAAKLIYMQMVQDRIKMCPSMQFSLCSKRSDTEIMESIFTRYPDAAKKEYRDYFKKVVDNMSPMALVMGNSKTQDGKDYSSDVLDIADASLRDVAKAKEKGMSLLSYRDMVRSISSEGIMDNSSSMDAFKDGKIVRRMVENGKDRKEIMSLMDGIVNMDTVKASGLNSKDVYVEKLISSAEEVKNRISLIRDFSPSVDGRMNISDKYRNFIHEYTLGRNENIIRTHLDNMAVKNLILCDRYGKEDVTEMLKIASPVAAEHGRGEGYASYVFDTAHKEVMMEIERAEGLLMPRLKPGVKYDEPEPIQDEYEYFKEIIEKETFIPEDSSYFGEIMAEPLLAEGYSAEDVASLMYEKYSDIDKPTWNVIVHEKNKRLGEKTNTFISKASDYYNRTFNKDMIKANVDVKARSLHERKQQQTQTYFDTNDFM